MSPLQKEFPDPEVVMNIQRLAPSRHAIGRDKRDYIRQVTKTVLHLDEAFRYENLNSPYAANSKEIVQAKTEVFNLVNQGNITVDTVRKIFTTRMFVDKFKEFLGESVPNYFDAGQTFLNLFMDLLNGESFRAVLDVLDNSIDELVKGKVSAFLNLAVATQRGHTWVALIVENYVDHEDLESLYKFASAINYLHPNPVDIFPYKAASFDPLIKKVFKSDSLVFKNDTVMTIMEQVFMYYYLGTLSRMATHADIIEWLTSKQAEVVEALGESIQDDKNFLFIHLYTGLSHRSSTISGIFLFIAVQLLHCPDPAVHKCLKSPDAGLVANVKTLATCKFLHGQYAARRLFAILLDDPWRDFLLIETEKAKTFFEDLSTTSAANRNKRSLLSTLMLDMVDQAYAHLPANKDQVRTYPGAFLLSDSLFHQALGFVTKAKNQDAATEVVSLFLQKMSKALFSHNLLEASDKLKTTTKNKVDKTQQEVVQITLADIQLITSFIHKLASTDKYTIRNNMLNCLRHLLQHSRTFEFLKKETHIHLRLIAFCKEGRNMNFNKSAWKLFYQLIHYHKEALEQFEKSKVLAQFLDILGPNSGNIIMLNSIHYTYKLFSLMDREPDRIKMGKSVSRGGDTKSLEKDLKTLSKIFMNSHLFIKIHMIYKRLMGHTQGASFIQLALLYHTIGKNPLYKSLYKDILRNPEYKDGINKLCAMFELSHPLTPLTSATSHPSSTNLLSSFEKHSTL